MYFNKKTEVRGMTGSRGDRRAYMYSVQLPISLDLSGSGSGAGPIPSVDRATG